MTPDEQENLVQELETALDRLQALYNQYFMGIERLEPTIQHKEVVRKVATLRREKITNTALRFRFQTQVQKYNTQSNYWKRISRQIEEGTYQRDVIRAQKRGDRRNEAELAEKALRSLEEGPAAPRAGSVPLDTGLELDDPFSEQAVGHVPSSAGPEADPGYEDPDKTPVPAVGSGIHPAHEQILRSARADADDDEDEDEDEGDLSTFFQKRPSLPPPPGPAKPAPPAPPAPRQGSALPRPSARSATRAAAEPAKPAKAAPSAQLSEERMKAIYRAYVTARKKTNEPTDNLTFAKIAALLKKQAAEKADIRDFKVVIRNGKAIIKTVKE